MRRHGLFFAGRHVRRAGGEVGPAAWWVRSARWRRSASIRPIITMGEGGAVYRSAAVSQIARAVRDWGGIAVAMTTLSTASAASVSSARCRVSRILATIAISIPRLAITRS